MDKDALLQNFLPAVFQVRNSAPIPHSILVLLASGATPFYCPDNKGCYLEGSSGCPGVFRWGRIRNCKKNMSKGWFKAAKDKKLPSYNQDLFRDGYNQDLFRDGNLEGPKGGQKIVQ